MHYRNNNGLYRNGNTDNTIQGKKISNWKIYIHTEFLLWARPCVSDLVFFNIINRLTNSVSIITHYTDEEMRQI